MKVVPEEEFLVGCFRFDTHDEEICADRNTSCEFNVCLSFLQKAWAHRTEQGKVRDTRGFRVFCAVVPRKSHLKI